MRSTSIAAPLSRGHWIRYDRRFLGLVLVLTTIGLDIWVGLRSSAQTRWNHSFIFLLVSVRSYERVSLGVCLLTRSLQSGLAIISTAFTGIRKYTPEWQRLIPAEITTLLDAILLAFAAAVFSFVCSFLCGKCLPNVGYLSCLLGVKHFLAGDGLRPTGLLPMYDTGRDTAK